MIHWKNSWLRCWVTSKIEWIRPKLPHAPGSFTLNEETAIRLDFWGSLAEENQWRVRITSSCSALAGDVNCSTLAVNFFNNSACACMTFARLFSLFLLFSIICFVNFYLILLLEPSHHRTCYGKSHFILHAVILQRISSLEMAGRWSSLMMSITGLTEGKKCHKWHLMY